MSNSDWWAKQLGNNTPQVAPRVNNNPMPVSQQPMTVYQAPQQQTPPMSKAQSALQNLPCPECGGGNYMSPQPKTIALRCYDCGYPVTQAGSRYGALTGATIEGAAKGAIGNDVRNNFNPMPQGYNSDGSKR